MGLPCLAIETQGLTKSFGDTPVLNGLNLKVNQGETVAIFGPNGAGKTTLIKILATIMNPSSGSVLIGGLNVKNEPEKARRLIGIVTHQTYLYNNLTAYENLDFYGRMYDIPDRKERVTEVLSVVKMVPRQNDRVGTLSRGMQQRVSIARALLHRPAIMLLDEPETGLDQQALSLFWEALQTDGEPKRSLVLTTHSLERGLTLGDRLLILNRGKIVCERAAETTDIADLREIYRQFTGTRT